MRKRNTRNALNHSQTDEIPTLGLLPTTLTPAAQTITHLPNWAAVAVGWVGGDGGVPKMGI